MRKAREYRHLVEVWEEQLVSSGLYDTTNEVLLGSIHAKVTPRISTRILEDGSQVSVNNVMFSIRNTQDFTITNNCYFVFNNKRYNFVGNINVGERNRNTDILTIVKQD